MNRLVSAMSVVAAVLAALGVLTVKAAAQVRFDGKECYLSEKSESLQVTDEGYLEWSAPGEQMQLTFRLPKMRITEVGDIAEVRCLYKVDVAPLGRSGIPGARREMPASGSFRMGLFDSNGKGHVESDGYGPENDIWKGYAGYYVQVYPHISSHMKQVTRDGEVQLPGQMIKRTIEEGAILLPPPAEGRNVGRGISGFGAPAGKFVPLFIQLKRAGPGTIHFTVTIDNISYLRILEDIPEQLDNIDAFSIYFPQQWPDTKMTLAPMSAAKSALKAPLKPTSMRHVDVYNEPGRFGGWPAGYSANQWIWGNEIMVSFRRAYYKANPTTHTVDWSKPSRRAQARSLDGGETWVLEEPKRMRGAQGWPDPTTDGVNFAHPDFAMRVGGRFSISYDRGRTWQGRYPFTGIDFGMSSRHDYMVQGPKDCMFFLSAGQPGVNGSNHSDRSFMARTTDGGKSFKFGGWLTDQESIRIRSVMPSAVRTSPTRLVAATRRKLKDDYTRKNSNWIEVSESTDNGISWKYLSKVGDTDRGEENGSPPAMVCLKDGRLAIAYGYRSYPLGIRAKISEDGGRTWSDEIVLRDDGHGWDLGYPRMVQRPDGKLVTMYYHNTRENPQPHIVATIWDPDTVR